MKCIHCGKEFSDKVCVIHMKNCKKEEIVDTKLTVKELREMCKEKGLKGYSKLNEAELVKMLQGSV